MSGHGIHPDSVAYCPWCNSRAVKPHCTSHTCTWVRCTACNCFGEADGSRKALISR